MSIPVAAIHSILHIVYSCRGNIPPTELHLKHGEDFFCDFDIFREMMGPVLHPARLSNLKAFVEARLQANATGRAVMGSNFDLATLTVTADRDRHHDG